MSGQTTPTTGKTTGTKAGVKPIPQGYHTVTPYLVVDGATKLIDFMTRAFQAKIVDKMQGPDGKIGHADLMIGDSHIMLGDANQMAKAAPCSIYLYVEDADTVYRRAIEAGATSVNEPANQFYGDRSGCVKDFAGNTWWIASHVEDVPHDELMRRAQDSMKNMQKH